MRLVVVFHVEEEISKLVGAFQRLLLRLLMPVVHVASHADRRLVLVNVLLVLFRLLMLVVVDVVEWHRGVRVVVHVVQERVGEC